MRNRYAALLLIVGLIILIWVIAHLDSKVQHIDIQTTEQTT